MGCILYLYPQSQWGLGRGISVSLRLPLIWSSFELFKCVAWLFLYCLSLSHCCCFGYCSSCCLWNGNVNNAFCLSISWRRGSATAAADCFPRFGCVCVLCKLIFLFSSFVNWQIDIVYGMGYPHADWRLYESSIFCLTLESIKSVFPKIQCMITKWGRWFIRANTQKR